MPFHKDYVHEICLTQEEAEVIHTLMQIELNMLNEAMVRGWHTEPMLYRKKLIEDFIRNNLTMVD